MKLKHISFALLAMALVACAATAGASDNFSTETRTVKAGQFASLQVNGSLPVELRQVPDSAGVVIISASERAMPFVSVGVSDGTLVLHFTGRGRESLLASEVRNIKVYCGRNLSQLQLTGSGSIAAGSLHSQGDVTVVSTGSGSLALGSCQCQNLTAALMGSGSIAIGSVRARNVSTSLAGSGSLAAAGIDATAFNCTISGSGSATAVGKAGRASLALRGSGVLNATRLQASSLDVSVTGSGIIDYNRSTSNVKIVSGRDNGGKVTHL